MPKRDENGRFVSEEDEKVKEKIKEKEKKRKKEDEPKEEKSEDKPKVENKKEIVSPAVYSCNFYQQEMAVKSHDKVKDKDGKIINFKRGKHIKFNNGKYETYDEEEIKFLDAWDKGILRDPLINIKKLQAEKYE